MVSGTDMFQCALKSVLIPGVATSHRARGRGLSCEPHHGVLLGQGG